MDNEDIIFSPIGMALEEKEFIWEIIALGLNTTVDDPALQDLKEKFFEDLNEVGRIEFQNKAEIREKLYERG